MSKSDTSPALSADELLRLTSDIVAAYVSHNEISMADLPGMIRDVHGALGVLPAGSTQPVQRQQDPAVPIAKSVTPDHIICLEDGKKLKMLKRYLRTHYDLTPDAYREKWNLPVDYPMVAPNYAAKRSEYAKQIGLGRTADKRGKRGQRKSGD